MSVGLVEYEFVQAHPPVPVGVEVPDDDLRLRHRQGVVQARLQLHQQSCKMSQICQIYLCKNIEKLG